MIANEYITIFTYKFLDKPVSNGVTMMSKSEEKERGDVFTGGIMFIRFIMSPTRTFVNHARAALARIRSYRYYFLRTQ